MGFLSKPQKILFQAAQITRMTRVTNKNLHVATPKKGSKMAKKRGSKKGQKWPKMGVRKRVKKAQKIELSVFKKIRAHSSRISNRQTVQKF
jgi:hypothetical protein